MNSNQVLHDSNKELEEYIALCRKQVVGKQAVYVLELFHGKYYVGSSKHVDERIKQHFTGRGSKWTKQYKPIAVLQIIDNGGFEDEWQKTLGIGFLYGWKNVRGGPYISDNPTYKSYMKFKKIKW